MSSRESLTISLPAGRKARADEPLPENRQWNCPRSAPTHPAPPAPARPPAEAEVRKAAEAFEAAFLAEMLKIQRRQRQPEGFGGGAGEEAFASFLTQEYARLLAERGGIGLAEQVFEILKQRTRGA